MRIIDKIVRKIDRFVFRKHYKRMDKIYSNFLYDIEKSNDQHKARMRMLDAIWDLAEEKK